MRRVLLLGAGLVSGVSLLAGLSGCASDCACRDNTPHVDDETGECLTEAEFLAREPPPGDGGGCPENVDPVCGCDGETYNNDCNAESRNVEVRHAGACWW